MVRDETGTATYAKRWLCTQDDWRDCTGLHRVRRTELSCPSSIARKAQHQHTAARSFHIGCHTGFCAGCCASGARCACCRRSTHNGHTFAFGQHDGCAGAICR